MTKIYIKKNKFLIGAVLMLGMGKSLWGADIHWKNDFVFYGDNSEFFEPYRTGETILGQQGKSYLEAALGERAFLTGGVFGDFRSVASPAVTVKPLLSFEYREGGTKLIMGTLETQNRHGFLEPLEVTFLEFTRPVEYGFQWMEDDPAFKADLFLSWHQLNTPEEPEELDYGGVLREPLDGNFSLEEQIHDFHNGGQLFYSFVFNNWVFADGFRWKIPRLLGETTFALFGVLGGHLNGGDTSQIQWGGGGYLRARVAPGEGFEFFGIGWKGQDFYSQEGDANYMSYSDPDSSSVDQPHDFLRSDRTYLEAGVKKMFPMEGGASFEAELRFHWIDEWWAYSYRFAVDAPLDIFLLSTDKGVEKKHDDGKL
jgi:hypothetical protein